MSLSRRPASRDDLAAITRFMQAWETHWFGSPEHDESEVAEELELVDLATNSVLVHDEDGPAGLAWWVGTDSGLFVRPGSRPDVRDALLDWLVAGDSPAIVILDRDEDTRSALEHRGWAHSHSSFELLRAVSDDWTLEEPVWPAGIEVGDVGVDEAAAVHRLVYEDARWTDVPDHVHRDLEQWRSIFLNEAALQHPQLVARRDGRPVGVALGRIFSDGTGWVAQLAVAVSERGKGLGRALLLAALRQHIAAGAGTLGLGVQAANRTALQLYLGVGLRVEREWQAHRRPPV